MSRRLHIVQGVIGCLLLTACPLHAEKDTLSNKIVHDIGFDAREGYVVPTRSFFKGVNAQGEPIRNSLSAHLKYAFRFSKDSEWGRLYPHAYQGVGVAYTSFFNAAEIGNPVSVYVFQGSRIANLSPRLTLDYEWNFGVSFGWKKFDPIDNPYNDVVGSKINAYMNVGILLSWKFAPHWSLIAGVEGTHYSNGNSNYPNSGVNTIGGRIGLTRTFHTGKAGTKPSLSAGRLDKHTFCYDLILYGATRRRGEIWPDESYLIPGSFGIAGINFNPMFRFNKYFRAGASLDVQYDESANLKGYLAGTDPETNEKQFYRPPFHEQLAAGLSLRAELSMPIFSINVGIGHNLYAKGEDTEGFYQILALKTFVTRRIFLHVGYQLSKFRDPNNLMLGLGYRFGK